MTLDQAIHALSKEGTETGKFSEFLEYLKYTEPNHCALNRWLIELKKLRKLKK